MSSYLLRADGAQLYVDTVEPRHESDAPPLVLLHGGPGADSRYLRPQLDALASLGTGRRLVYYDQRGAERSPLDPGVPPGGYEAHVRDVDVVRASLGVERLTLGGYSWGGLLALLYAIQHPERIERLLLIAPAPAHASGRAEFQRRMSEAASRPAVQALRAELIERMPTVDAETARRWRFALAITGYFVEPRRALELTPFRVLQRIEEAIWRSLADYDLRPQLERLVGLPILIVHGEQDVIPIATAEETARLVGAELVRLPACGHVPYIEAPGPLFAAIERFLSHG